MIVISLLMVRFTAQCYNSIMLFVVAVLMHSLYCMHNALYNYQLVDIDTQR
jgi:hypothetical protein